MVCKLFENNNRAGWLYSHELRIKLQGKITQWLAHNRDILILLSIMFICDEAKQVIHNSTGVFAALHLITQRFNTSSLFQKLFSE